MEYTSFNVASMYLGRPVGLRNALGFLDDYFTDEIDDDLAKLLSALDQKETKMGDAIHKPAHYCYSKYEPKDVIREWGLNFNLGSAVKYIARAGRKDDILQDLKKAREFLGFEIEAIEEERAAKKVAKFEF